MTNKLGGYQGKYLEIDLSNRRFEEKELPRRYMEDFIGGAGINTRLAFDYIKQGDKALSPDNSLILGVGPFVGTFIPGSCKGTITGRSPINEKVGSAGGGQLGKLKFAGYDNLVITGKSDKPVYLKVTEKGAEFCDASHLWGKDIWEATDAIWDEIGPIFTVAAIGPAGEKMVKSAGIIFDKWCAFARCGLGAVMGDKNLKAIAIYGSGKVSVSDPDRFTSLLEKFWTEFNSHPLIKDWRKFGTLMSLEPMARLGLYPVRNYREDFGMQVLKDFDLNDLVDRVKIKDVSCLSCPLGCKHHLRINKPSGKDREMSVSCMNAVLMSVGTSVGLAGWDTVLSMAELTTRYGLDLYDMSTILGMAFELYERGIIDRKLTDGLELTWGNEESVKEIIRKTAYREGFGDILAEGVLGAAERIGKGAEDYSMHIKRMGIPHDPRPNLGSTELFSQIISSKAHPTNIGMTITVKRTADQIKRFLQRAGVPEANINRIMDDPSAVGYNVGRVTKWVEDIATTMDCMGLCFYQFFQRFGLDVWAQIYSALTGIEVDRDSLLASTQKIWDARKALSEREGWTRAEDTLPKRFKTESVKLDDIMIPPFEQSQIDIMISDYYDERGWDRNTGTVTPARKKELGLPPF